MEFDIETIKKKWKPIYEVFVKEYQHIDLETLAIVCESSKLYMINDADPGEYFHWDSGNLVSKLPLSEEERIKRTLIQHFCPFMIRLYCRYKLTNHKEIFNEYEKLINKIQITHETLFTFDEDKFLAKFATNYLRKEKLRKINGYI